MRSVTLSVILAIALLAWTPAAHARQPILEQPDASHALVDDPKDIYTLSQQLGDPAHEGTVVFGELKTSDEIDMYMIFPRGEDPIRVELMVPAKIKNRFFFPTLMVVGPALPRNDKTDLPIRVPLGFDAMLVPTPASESRETMFLLLGLHRLHHGVEVIIPPVSNKPYYLSVYNPAGRVGTYALVVGDGDGDGTSVRSTFVSINPETIVFDDSLTRGYTEASEPTAYEKSLFPKPQTPFETFDNRLKLWIDYLVFFLFRATTVIF